MTTLHDVIRNMIRGGWPNDEVHQRQALLAVDAHEAGYPDAETYQAELDKQAAAANRPPSVPGQESDAERSDRLQAENERLRAQIGGLRSPAPSSSEGASNNPRIVMPSESDAALTPRPGTGQEPAPAE